MDIFAILPMFLTERDIESENTGRCITHGDDVKAVSILKNPETLTPEIR